MTKAIVAYLKYDHLSGKKEEEEKSKAQLAAKVVQITCTQREIQMETQFTSMVEMRNETLRKQDTQCESVHSAAAATTTTTTRGCEKLAPTRSSV